MAKVEKDNFDLVFKIVVVGNSAVGKSSLLLRFSEGDFKSSMTTTTGVDLKIKKFSIDGKIVKLAVWDTAGQERYRHIAKSYYKGAQGIMFVYDITNQDSFNEIQNWVREVHDAAGDDLVKMLIGNKSDLEDSRVIQYEDGKKLADELQMTFFETSAKTFSGVDSAFLSIAERLVKKFPKGTSQGQKIGTKESKKKGCCS